MNENTAPREECAEKSMALRQKLCQKTLEKRIEESGVSLTGIGEYDWGEPQGNEIVMNVAAE